MDFVKAIEGAQRLPEAPSHESPLPDIFKNPHVQQLMGSVGPEAIKDTSKIPGVIQYQFVFQSARLQIGKEQVDFSNGQAIYEERDDSARLKEIMDRILAGEAILNKKTETILNNGTVILWMEWLERAPATPKKRDFLTTAELLSPEPLQPDESSVNSKNEPTDTE